MIDSEHTSIPPHTAKKKSLFSGLALLLLLLVIPIGVYVVSQQQSVADTRSQAAILYKAVAPVSKATPTPTPHFSQRCNLTCTKDTDCGESMSCVKVNGVQKCRYSQCPDVDDCWCNKVVTCNASCTDDTQCGTGKICAKIDGVGKCRNAQCYGVDDCICYTIGGTPTPTPTPLVRCNSSCAADGDCGTSMICVKTAEGNKCRNPQCYGASDCLCYSLVNTPTPTKKPVVKTTVVSTQKITATPIPSPSPTIASMLVADLSILATPTPTPATTPPDLSIDVFYDAKQETKNKPVISGTTDANADVTITISPDAITDVVTADTTGLWNYTPSKALTSGAKQMTVVASSKDGLKTTKVESFVVKGGFQIPTAIYVILGMAVAVGVGVFLGKRSSAMPPPQQG